MSLNAQDAKRKADVNSEMLDKQRTWKCTDLPLASAMETHDAMDRQDVHIDHGIEDEEEEEEDWQ